jgi:hypothetical protein
MAVGTGFGQLFRSVGQVCASHQEYEPFSSRSVKVGGVAVSSAVFQSVLDSELRKRIRGPDANEVSSNLRVPRFGSPVSLQTIRRIRESAKLVVSLPPDLQRLARDSYDRTLRIVFIMAMCSTLMAYIVRLPVSFVVPSA